MWLDIMIITHTMTKGHKKKNLVINPRLSCIQEDTSGILIVVGIPSSPYPHSFNARCHTLTVCISCAVIAGVFPFEVSANRSAPYSISFCMHPNEPLTRAQCKG